MGIVTNQSGVARGLLDEVQLARIHRHLIDMLTERGARPDAVFYCPHHPDHGEPPYRCDCDCRKPRPGMLLRAATELTLDLGRSFMLGDRIQRSRGRTTRPAHDRSSF